jgi:hypothetical protein
MHLYDVKVSFLHKYCSLGHKFEILDKSTHLYDVKVSFLHKYCSFWHKFEI